YAVFAGLLALLCPAFLPAQSPPALKVLFLGDNGHHRPADRFRELQPAMAKRNIDITYTDKPDALDPKILSKYDGLIVYANIDEITPAQEKALLEFVESGKGFIPLHCASYCFRNSQKYVDLVGAQFLRHGTGTFRTTLADVEHPILKGFQSFSSWDETYVHTKHNEKDRTVLEYRDEANPARQGWGGKEPWTWVRTQGKGRVFYTAWGHDQRTWTHPGFQNLVERGIRWACGQDPTVVAAYFDKPEMTKLRTDVKPFEYVPAKVPFYPPSTRWGVTSDPLTKMQKPLSTEESMKHFVTPVGFEVKLWVDETKFGGGKPICMAWDEQGRLWVALTVDYPNNKQPEGEGHDRIVICEDTKGAGVCDKVTVFAEKLSIPTSILPCFGGVIVHQAPHTLFLKDTTGNGKADFKQILFTGWGVNDTHAGPSNLRYGLDNWIYGIVGYAGYRGEVAGERLSFSQGFYRFKIEPSPQRKQGELRVTKLEFLRSTSNNSWGVGFNEEGQLFGSTANGCPIVHMPIPNRYYEKVRGLAPTVLRNIAPDNHFEPITDKVRQVDFHGGFTAAAGCGIYTARTYPKEYWNRTAFVCEPTGHLVATFELTPDGASYKARYGWNLLASDDEWSAPIMAEVGPDGNVWVIDWYNFIVQHNPTPPGFKTGKGAAYETDLRDKTHGRIYRIVYTGAKPEKPMTLKDATPEKLVETLKNPNMMWRLQAQRLLVERGKDDVLPALAELAQQKSGDEIGPGHAIQTVDGLIKEDFDLLDTGLQGSPFRDRKTLPAILDHKSLAARLSALRLYTRYPFGGIVMARLLDEQTFKSADPEFQLALLLAISDAVTRERYLGPPPIEPEPSDGARLAALLTSEAMLHDRALLDAFSIVAQVRSSQFLVDLPQKRALPEQSLQIIERAAADYISSSERPNVVAFLISRLLAKMPEFDVSVNERIVNGLASGLRVKEKVPLTEEEQEAIKKLLPSLRAASRGKLIRLASALGVQGFDAQLAEIAKTSLSTALDAKATDDSRVDAIRQYVELRDLDAATVEQLLATITPQSSPQFTSGVLDAIASRPSADVAPALLKRLAAWPPSARTAAVRVLLGRTDFIRVLLDGIEKGQVQLSDLALEQREALAAHSDRRIAARAKALLAKGGGLPDPDRQKVIDAFLPNLKKTGDPVAGKLVFKNNCAKCHRHSGEGEQIGPDLSGVAVHPKEHLLIDILDPSRSVEGNFRVYRVEMKDGRTFSGLLASETKSTIELVDAETKRHVLQRSEIEELQASPKSLMPEGFEKQLKPEDLVNLLEFLTQKGKYLPLPLDKAATVVSTKGMFYSEDAPAERLIFQDWSPKTFEGIPFTLVDPQKDQKKNVILLYGPQGTIPPKMPKSVEVQCNTSAKAIHLLSGVSGWGYPYSEKGSVSMIVRLHYAGGKTEDHSLQNGEHLADYIRRVDVPESKFAFALRGQQIRYLAIKPGKPDVIEKIEFVKGPDQTAPVVMAVTVETGP
ncbi:MAG TPA: PVC-type heme-binding CxxCH protein, partial [Gemmataceae bacterium]|nr:PVC-type heme-binding CxxCH protein [Gemmataceae bacterium]